MIPATQFEEMKTTEGKYGGNSKPMSTHLPFMLDACRETGCIAIYLNQLRDKVGIQFGNPETTPGGRALKFFASIRIRTSIESQLKSKEGESSRGVHIKAKVVKNKVAAPYRTGEYDLIYGKGIDRVGDLVDVAKAKDILQLNGSWYSYGETRVGQGRDAAIAFLTDNPELRKTITDALWVVTR